MWLSFLPWTLLLYSCSAQVTKPVIKLRHEGCLPEHVEECKMNCLAHYQDPRRYLCPCYSKMGLCLQEIGCSMKQKTDIFLFCTRKGYCKDGYCTYREGDLQPKGDIRSEIFARTAVVAPATPCIDNCCVQNASCSRDESMEPLRLPGRNYRIQEVQLPPRLGDIRLGVNQDYDCMPYSIPLEEYP